MTATREFIDKYKADVVKATQGTGLFPSVKMAQMILESSWGKGITAVQANNYFGIKADSSWTGPKMAFSTPKDGQKVNYFRVYKSVYDSIVDHSKFLRENSRYAKAGVFSSVTPEDQAADLDYASYAEADNYDKTLISIINQYNLKELDGMATYKAISVLKNNRLFFVVSVTIIALGAGYMLMQPYRKP